MKEKIITFFSLAMMLTGCEYISDQEWLEPYRVTKNDNDYILYDFDIKNVSPYKLQEGDDALPKYKYYSNIQGNEDYMQAAAAGRTTSNITPEEAAAGLSGTTSLPLGIGLRFPFRNGAVITSFYGWRSMDKNIEFHEGVDLVGTNKEIYASGYGTVVMSEKRNGYGETIAVEYSGTPVSTTNNASSNAQLANMARRFANNVNRTLSGDSLKEFREFLEHPLVQESSKNGQDMTAIELMGEYITRILKAYPQIKDPRSLILIGDMENTGSHLEYLDNIKSSLGTSNEFEAVYKALKNNSYWSNPASKNGAYTDIWMRRVDNTYKKVKEMNLTKNLNDNSLKLLLSDIVAGSEGDYTSINPNDEGIFSYGRAGFRGYTAALALNYTADALEGKLSNGTTSPSLKGGKVFLFYAHLAERKVKVGDTVTENTIIGIEGSTGKSYGNHLHLSGYIDDLDSKWNYSNIYNKPTSLNSSNRYTEDPLSKIFLVKTEIESTNTLGFTLKIKGANGSRKEAIPENYMAENLSFSTTPEIWEGK